MSIAPTPRKYIAVAALVVVGLFVLIAKDPRPWFGIFDPGGAAKLRQDRALHARGASDIPLTQQEAEELFEQYSAGTHAAGDALAWQDQKHGLPEAFIAQLGDLLVSSGGEHGYAASLVERLATHREFGSDVERAFVKAMHPPSGGTRTFPIRALGKIGTQRPLADDTLEALLAVTETRSNAERTALESLSLTAQEHGLPDWALHRIQAVANHRPGPIRGDAIQVLAAAGANDRAKQTVIEVGNGQVSAAALATTLAHESLTELLATLEDGGLPAEMRAAALVQIIKQRNQSDTAGAALTYALRSNVLELRRSALANFAAYGRHHLRFIELDWASLYRRAFDASDDGLRRGAQNAFRFSPFTAEQRGRFLLEMLNGTERQQLAALRVISRTSEIPSASPVRIEELLRSKNTDVAQLASMIIERGKPGNPLKGLGKHVAMAFFWALLALPALIMVGFGTYFIARLIYCLSNQQVGRALAALAISAVWLVLSLALALGLFMGVLGWGHSGKLSVGIYLLLVSISAVYAAFGWLLRVPLRRQQSAHPD